MILTTVFIILFSFVSSKNVEMHAVDSSKAMFSHSYVNPNINYTADCSTYSDCFNCTISQCFWDSKFPNPNNRYA